MLALSLILLGSVSAQAHTPDLYRAFDRVQSCAGQDKYGRPVTFRLEETKFTGTRYQKRHLRKIRVDGEKLGRVNLLTGEAGCGDGDKGRGQFKIFEGRFSLRLDCRKTSVVAKGRCEGAPAVEVDDGPTEGSLDDTLVGD